MNSCLKYFSASLLALATQAAFAQVPQLGAADFAVLSAAPGGLGAVTCTDSNVADSTIFTITGDVGSSGPLASVTNTGCVIPSIIAPVSPGVLADFNGAYDALAGQSCDSFLTTLDVAQTLSPGVYCFAAAATATDKVLTLAGSSTDTWLFKIGTSGTGALTGTGFSVVMADGTPVTACNVTWWVAEAATMKDSKFNGTILAGAAITTTRGTFDGRALAKAGVTITDSSLTGCTGGSLGGTAHPKCNQGVGNGPEGCDPGNSNQGNPFRSNDEVDGAVPGNPGRKGGNNN
jgi:hypothetical protein